MLDLSHPIPQRLYHIADIIEFISSINSSIMMKTIEVCKSFTILTAFTKFLPSTNSYMMKKTTEMCNGFTILTTLTGFVS